MNADALSGRLVVRVDASDGAAARSENAAFELQGDAKAGVTIARVERRLDDVAARPRDNDPPDRP